MSELVNLLAQTNRALRHGDNMFYLKKTKRSRKLLRALVMGGVLSGFVSSVRGHFIVSVKASLQGRQGASKKLLLLSKPTRIEHFTVYKLKSLMWKNRRVQVLLSTSGNQVCVLDWGAQDRHGLGGGIVLGLIIS